MRYRPILVVCIMAGLLFFFARPLPVRSQSPVPVVRAVLFYSPTCPHCHKVISEDLPPLFDKYGDQLEVIGVDVSQPGGQALYQAAIQRFSIPNERLGVPTLIMGDVVLVGSLEIPERFPGLIEVYLAQGGVDWPDIPGLAKMMDAAQGTQDVQSSPTPLTPTPSLTISTLVESTPLPDPEPAATPESLILTGEVEASLEDRLAQDPVGNGLAIVVLIGMIISVGWGVWYFQRTPGLRMTGAVLWIIPALCIVGMGVAGYLAYVETAQVEAVCGPVGDCNTVQQSEYARLFGILPVGMLGTAGYAMIIAAWIIARRTKYNLADYAALAMLAMTAFGTLFSIYLTFLEPFVIGATCAWCLTSAALMTVLFWLSLTPGRAALARLLHGERYTCE